MSVSFLRYRFRASLLLAALLPAAVSAVSTEELAAGCRSVVRHVASAPPVTHDGSVFPPPQLQIRTPLEPMPFPSAGRQYLVYELHLQNFSDAAVEIRGIEVLDADTQTPQPLANFSSQQLGSILVQYGDDSAGGVGGRFPVAGGRGAVGFICLAFEEGATIPRTLRHRVSLTGAAVIGPVVTISQAKLPVLAPPVSGTDWIAANGPSNNSHHRTGLFVVDGAVQISRRYAIDWRQVREGFSFAGDALDVRSYHAYAQEVFAVADATVVSTRDDLPDNVPRTAAGFSTALPVTMDTAPGNRVVLDLGEGRFAYYAHLQAGSLRVKAGDRVKRGQPLARIGNSGDSRWPHLHFQVATASDVLAAEGVPYVIDRYRVRTKDGIEERTLELPVRDTLIDFERTGPAL